MRWNGPLKFCGSSVPIARPTGSAEHPNVDFRQSLDEPRCTRCSTPQKGAFPRDRLRHRGDRCRLRNLDGRSREPPSPNLGASLSQSPSVQHRRPAFAKPLRRTSAPHFRKAPRFNSGARSREPLWFPCPLAPGFPLRPGHPLRWRARFLPPPLASRKALEQPISTFFTRPQEGVSYPHVGTRYPPVVHRFIHTCGWRRPAVRSTPALAIAEL
jgi:hypothetical protein